MDELTRRGEPVDLAAFNIMLGICAQCGDLQEALSILDRMRKRSLHPDVISYTSLLKTCSRTSGDRGIALAKAEELFSAMQHAPYPVAPNRNTLRYLLKVHQAAKSPDIERVFSLFVLAKDRELCDHEIADLVASMLVTRGDPRRGVVMEWKRNHP